MDAIASARALLPPWVVWGNALLYPLMAFLLSLFGVWLGVRIASAPQRLLTPSSPWTERARQTFPVRMMALRSSFFALIVFAVLGFAFSGPVNRVPAGVLGLLGGAAAFAAAACIRWRVVRQVGLGASGLRAWLRGLLIDALVLRFPLLVALFLFVLLPDHLGATALSVLAIGLLLLFGSAWGVSLVLAWLAGLARPADEQLQKLVETAASKIGIRPRAVYVVSSTMPGAWAFPLGKRLVFTEAILTTLDEGELAVVCAHELGHLTEPLLVLLCRLSPLLLVAALAAGRLIFAVGGLPALVGLSVAVWLALPVLILLSRLSQRMERRADRIAAGHEGTGEVYARALEKIHRANLIPAVLHGKLATHPHLYDRLLAAGVTPAYERPRPPPRKPTLTAMIVHAVLISILIVGSFSLRSVLSYARMREREPVVLCSLALGGGSTDLSHLAYLHYKRGDKEGAVVFYRAATELDPDSVYGPANLAITLAALDRCEEARKAAEEAASRGTKNNSPTNKLLVQLAFDALSRCQARTKIAQNAAPLDEDEMDP